ncbi:MAG: hypothetical protein RR320_05075, partial [Oscillospiraceae bacterium]
RRWLLTAKAIKKRRRSMNRLRFAFAKSDSLSDDKLSLLLFEFFGFFRKLRIRQNRLLHRGLVLGLLGLLHFLRIFITHFKHLFLITKSRLFKNEVTFMVPFDFCCGKNSVIYNKLSIAPRNKNVKFHKSCGRDPSPCCAEGSSGKIGKKEGKNHAGIITNCYF